MDPLCDGSLAYRICYIGGLWGFKGVEGMDLALGAVAKRG